MKLMLADSEAPKSVEHLKGQRGVMAFLGIGKLDLDVKDNLSHVTRVLWELELQKDVLENYWTFIAMKLDKGEYTNREAAVKALDQLQSMASQIESVTMNETILKRRMVIPWSRLNPVISMMDQLYEANLPRQCDDL